MKIDLNKTEFNKCLKLLETKELNIEASEYYIDYLNNHFRDIDDALDSKDWFEQFDSILCINSNVIKNSKMKNITILDNDEFLNNDYYKTIGQIKVSNKDWHFTSLNYAAFEGFVSDEISVNDEYFQEFTPISYFKKPFKFLAVLQNDEIWMSIMPHEINTMKKPISTAFGNVLVLGLGLGYFAFMVSNKNNVSKVTIIENDQKIIDLFTTYIFPKFPNKNKIEIIKNDAIEFVKNSPRKFNYIFADIWHNVGDGEMLYLKLKNKEKFHPESRFDYWIETSILAMLRRQTLTVFEEQINGSTDEDYLKAKNDHDRIINKIYLYYKNYQIKTFNDLHQILTDDSLKVLASKLI